MTKKQRDGQKNRKIHRQAIQYQTVKTKDRTKLREMFFNFQNFLCNAVLLIQVKVEKPATPVSDGRTDGMSEGS